MDGKYITDIDTALLCKYKEGLGHSMEEGRFLWELTEAEFLERNGFPSYIETNFACRYFANYHRELVANARERGLLI